MDALDALDRQIEHIGAAIERAKAARHPVYVQCEECHGAGVIMEPKSSDPADADNLRYVRDCDICHGAKVVPLLCSYCTWHPASCSVDDPMFGRMNCCDECLGLDRLTAVGDVVVPSDMVEVSRG